MLNVDLIQVLGAYSVSKTALLGLTKVLAQQLGADNIRVNCVAPGIIRTKFSDAVRNLAHSAPAYTMELDV